MSSCWCAGAKITTVQIHQQRCLEYESVSLLKPTKGRMMSGTHCLRHNGWKRFLILHSVSRWLWEEISKTEIRSKEARGLAESRSFLESQWVTRCTHQWENMSRKPRQNDHFFKAAPSCGKISCSEVVWTPLIYKRLIVWTQSVLSLYVGPLPELTRPYTSSWVINWMDGVGF